MLLSRVFVAVGGVLLAASSVAAPAPAASPVTIELSHQLDEERAERLEPLVENFNRQQKDVQVTLVRRVEGSAPRQLNLVTREEYARFAANRASFRPLHEVMREARENLDAGKLAPEMRNGVSNGKGQLDALPFAYSTPVLYINREAFRKAGLNPDNPPKTWFEVQEAAGKLVDAGSTCAFTTSWPAWVLIDNMSARNGGEVNDERGRLAFNGLLQVKHVAMLASWHKSKYFTYFGRRDEADRRFGNGECAMLTSNSALYANLVAKNTVDVGVSALPYHDDAYGAPKTALADGASLWVGSGLKAAETKGVAKFVNYVLGPEVQVGLTLAGGYLPMTSVARTAAGSKLMKSDLQGLQVAYAQLQGAAVQPALRVSQIEPVRIIVEEELEAVWANKKPAKEALDNAVTRGNAVLPPAQLATARNKRRM